MITPPLHLVVLKTGSPVPLVKEREGEFAAMFAAKIRSADDLASTVVTEIDLIDGALEDQDPTFEDVDGVIMSGSAAMIGEDLPWMLRATRLVKDLAYASTPFLGVCFGHQVLGRALGADVGPNSRGRTMGSVDVTLTTPDPLMDALPKNFVAQVSHVDVIRTPGPHLQVIGHAPHDPCHIVRFGTTTWGVQYHPEFSPWTVEHYLRAREATVDAERGEHTAQKWIDNIQASDDATSLLAHFARFCQRHRDGERG